MKDKAEFTDFDKKCMARAMSLAKKGLGKVSPNPLVGAVIAKDNRIIGEGWHRQFSGKHAEPEALDNVARRSPGKNYSAAAGADLYCTLEPCCFTSPEKKQPPCTDFIIQSGIRRVVIANLDPNPKVNGGGVRILEKAGIIVQSGLLAAEGEILNEGFFTYQRLGRPFIRLKTAQSLDGRIAASSGDSRWITDEKARRIVHGMRSRHDAILIGSGTALADDPELTVRLARGPNPYRVVLDSGLKMPLTSRLFNLPDKEKTIVFCSAKVSTKKITALRCLGVQVIQIDDSSGTKKSGAQKGSGIPLKAVLKELAKRNILSVLVEGGSGILTSFLKEGLWDRYAVFTSPIILGQGINSVGDLGIKIVKDAVRLYDVSIKILGDQVLYEGSRTLTMEETNVYRNR